MESTLLPKIISLPVAVGLSILFILSIIDLAKKLQLFDANNELKHHMEKVCSLGGIAIFAAFWIASCLLSGIEGHPALNYLFVGSFILFLTGVRDDLIGIAPLKRLFIQIGVASLMFVGGIQLTYIPGLTETLPVWLSYLLTITLIGTVVNAYNFIDGINGLAGGLATISSLAFAIFFYFSGLPQFAAMALALAGALIGFLWFNFGTAKIFMGDNGSTFIGVMLSFFAITFLQNHTLSGGSINYSPVLLFAIMIIPIFDMIKVVIRRMFQGLSPFQGDRTHIHHLFLNAGFNQRKICYLIYSWSIVVIASSFNFLSQNILIGGLLLVLICSLPYVMLNRFASIQKEKDASKISSTKPSEIF